MKKKHILLVVLLLIIEQLPAQRIVFNPQSTKISITVKNPDSKEIVVETNPINLALMPSKPDQRKVTLDKNNSASTNILLKVPVFIKIMNVWKDSSMDFLVMPGNDFAAVFDAGDRNFVTYGGNWEKENEFYNFMMKDAQSRLDEISQNDPQVFMQEWEKQNAYNLSLVQVANGDGINHQYTGWVLQSVHSLFYSTLIQQLVNYVTVNGKWPENMEWYIKSCEPLSNIQLNNASYFTSESDKDWVAKYYLLETVCKYYKEDSSQVPDLEMIYKSAITEAKKIKEPGVRRIMIQYLAKSAVDRTNDISFLNWLQNTLKTQSETQYYNSIISSRIQVLKIAPKGHPALVFDAEDKDGRTFSLTNYKGRYIYIDVWATWCIPCKKQIPYLEKLKKKYEGKPIDLISISQDKSIDAWKRFINKSKTTSDQFISNPDLKKSINNVYLIRFIPSFILIDPNGNILNSNCYTPSDPAMDMLLEKLLK